MKSSMSSVWVWWTFVAISFIIPYLFVSIEFEAGFNISDWNELHRQRYVGFVFITALLSFGITALCEYIKD